MKTVLSIALATLLLAAFLASAAPLGPAPPAALDAAEPVHPIAEAERFAQKIKLPTGQTAVVAEGDFEPRSIGTYTVRIYSGRNPQFPTDRYLSGLIQERDGFIEKLLLADVDADGHDELVVIARSAGTGNFQSAQAFTVGGKAIVLRAAVKDLPAGADPVAALRAKVKE